MEGHIAEVGVYQGGSAEIIANYKETHKHLFLFDTFEGLPDPDGKDWHKKGDFNDTDYETIRIHFKQFPNVHVYKGFFPNDTAHHVENVRFSFVHIDVDLYQCYLDCLNFFYRRMTQGGIIAMDDYGASSCPGAKLAVDKFFQNLPENLIWPTSCQIAVVKQ